MSEIKCPNCGKVFKIDEESYSLILQQVRNSEFNKEIDEQLENKLKLALNESENGFRDKLYLKENEISKLKEEVKLLKKENDNKLNELLFSKEKEINELKNQLSLMEGNTRLEILNALKSKDEEISRLKEENSKFLNQKDLKISELNNKLALNDSLNKEKNEEIKKNYETLLKAKQEEVDFYKDFKARQSTKLVGESLEVHCATEFNKLRPLFPNAYFDKDNEISKSGSKGDFIFRDYDEDKTEIVSIMFEMKNENDTTATKHKNEDFLKELDKDRNEKNCEYAVLVSMLEPDSELYNGGIVDVSYKYPKMYVVRPQFFIPIITLIRNGALNALSYKKELEIARNQDIDLSHFEENMNDFKDAFGRNYRIASEKFKTAIEEIDKTIDHLEKTKKALMSSENNLRLANNKAQEDLTIKKLTKNAPSIAEKFKV
ncbi:MAG: DUF2130 domain-containing protein [Solobacterium sp.]|nr:DUF2130 domain-containing protein [Erysipelotrichaceae bacterium]MCI6701025.1 DUF2130 domain-containing protein [Solobacterium sp.]MDD5983673.1 DUF2130 domain-containing protein [Solobacterium sp.]MDD6122643.1 DUF2130 domain-containing protein [Solobacterium sp.]MDD6835266.1 DUF2130 domain-containing protein [Solobacterium sp.]